MSQLVSHTTTASSSAGLNAPWTVKVLGSLVVLLALVTSYGAIYFSFYFEDPQPGFGSWIFAIVFIGINVAATAAAVALVRGSRLGWSVLVGYGLLGILWCIAKLVFWQETESLLFGVANVLGLVLLATRRTRRHVA
jgi:hypothetical protein